jgi:hypothetical protein
MQLAKHALACFQRFPRQMRVQLRRDVLCKRLAFGQYVQLVMDDSRRAGPDRRPGQVMAPGAQKPDGAAPASPVAAAAPKAAAPPKKDIRFIGGAMKSLFESADVSIRRDDETRVLSRAQEALADLQQRRGLGPEHPSEHAAHASRAPSSRPPGPRVDVVLWVVLAAGLFGIAGWMLIYGR